MTDYSEKPELAYELIDHMHHGEASDESPDYRSWLNLETESNRLGEMQARTHARMHGCKRAQMRSPWEVFVAENVSAGAVCAECA